MNCTEEMYKAFKNAAFGPDSDNETLADSMKNGIEAALEVKTKDVVWPEAIGRTILDGPNRAAIYRYAPCIRTYGEYSRESVKNSKGWNLEGEPVYTRSQVEKMLAQK